MKKNIAWIIRIVIAILFLVSAFSKMYNPETGQFTTWQFEKQLFDLKIADWTSSPYFARFIIGLEYAIAITIMFNHWIKKLIIPGTILLLVAFIIHLCITGAEYGFNNGNCGCFGQLLPMTPLEAIIKNILTIGLLIYLWFNVEENAKGINNIIYPVAAFLASSLFMFSFLPFAPFKKASTVVSSPVPPLAPELLGDTLIDTIAESDTTGDKIGTPVVEPNSTIVAVAPKAKDTVKKGSSKLAPSTPIKGGAPAKTNVAPKPSLSVTKSTLPKVVSKFAPFANFNGTIVKVDEERKLICMFAPGCDHCQHAAKEICALQKADPKFPQVAIIFMDEEAEKIPDFFKAAGCTFPYQVLDIPSFWTLLGNGSTPAVFAQENGNTLKSWEGITNNEFKAEYLKGVFK